MPNLCRQGVCGECRLPVRGGAIEHRDLFLTEEEKAAGDFDHAVRIPFRRRPIGAGSVTHRLAADHIARFPFPFPRDQYRYSTNVEPAGSRIDTAAGGWGDRASPSTPTTTANSPNASASWPRIRRGARCLPHMGPAAWDAMLTLMRMLADEYPGTMTLERHGGSWLWKNELLGIEQSFVFGDHDTLPAPPLVYICGQIQEDVVLLDQREGELWADAGLVTFAADWSFGFDVGMSFLEIHGPVPRVAQREDHHPRPEVPDAARARRELPAHQLDVTVDGKLDTSTETYPEWGRTGAPSPTAAGEVGDRLHLRTEVQHLIRLGVSDAICS